MSSICIFEDEGFSGLLPLVWLRPVYDLRCGISTLYEKIKRNYPRSNIYLMSREYLNPVIKKTHPGAFVGKVGKDNSVLFINGRILCDGDVAKKIPSIGADEIFECEGEIIAARLSKGNLELVANMPFTADTKKMFAQVRSTAKTTQVKVKLIKYYFDLITHNKEEITKDFNYSTRGGITRGRVHQTIAVFQRSGIFIDDGADIESFVTLDARKGPIFISKGACIQPNVRIEGPAFIGERTVIMANSNIRTGTSIGPDCRVGGEVEETIMHARSNKAHYGYIGHSYVGEWVNLGAGTTNSDLKNNYSNVRVQINKEMVDSGRMFLGCAIGDHTKIAIGSLINTGSVIGASSSIYGGRLMPKVIPSFVWGEVRQLDIVDVEKAIKTAKVVMARREVVLDDADADLIRKVFELSADERSEINP
jgi:UDP-N-acetylglucosamine diphosphorylase / glucose-1-phosphate thymidylyltransferase / UDP-N-acetylgalactosamine diphosphorylase / glucosamine-1-phosphate N-acetyltransferase / galactosamine-1-phosphate N-acetyltransferase